MNNDDSQRQLYESDEESSLADDWSLGDSDSDWDEIIEIKKEARQN